MPVSSIDKPPAAGFLDDRRRIPSIVAGKRMTDGRGEIAGKREPPRRTAVDVEEIHGALARPRHEEVLEQMMIAETERLLREDDDGQGGAGELVYLHRRPLDPNRHRGLLRYGLQRAGAEEEVLLFGRQRAEHLLGEVGAEIVGFRRGAERRQTAALGEPHPGELQRHRPALGPRGEARPVRVVEPRHLGGEKKARLPFIEAQVAIGNDRRPVFGLEAGKPEPWQRAAGDGDTHASRHAVEEEPHNGVDLLALRAMIVVEHQSDRPVATLELGDDCCERRLRRQAGVARKGGRALRRHRREATAKCLGEIGHERLGLAVVLVKIEPGDERAHSGQAICPLGEERALAEARRGLDDDQAVLFRRELVENPGALDLSADLRRRRELRLDEPMRVHNLVLGDAECRSLR